MPEFLEDDTGDQFGPLLKRHHVFTWEGRGSSAREARAAREAEEEDLLCVPDNQEAEGRVHCGTRGGGVHQVDRGAQTVLTKRGF
ncbi:unnamed protein product [Closterium sp. NIES-64]|nr:unnamed protein product [Closterium sp. NIES-64]